VSVSVVIVTFHNEREIEGCVKSVLAQPEARQVIVVDNASQDGTPALLARLAAAEPRLELLLGTENLGFGRAANLGLVRASGSRLLLLNPDAELLPGALAALEKGFAEHPEAGVLGLKVYDWDGRSVQLSCRAFPGHSTALFHRYSLLTRLWPKNRFSARYLATDFDHGQVASFDWVSGCAMALRREALERTGGFDERFFMFSEDVDLCKRARAEGFEVLYLPSAAVRHRIGGSSAAAPELVVRERHRSMWLYYKKHLRGGAMLDAVTFAGIGARYLWHRLRASAARSRPRRGKAMTFL
jgi:N-acetylglucosaminyl-diphospho-decaprenol L-rhamnosyltransferase